MAYKHRILFVDDEFLTKAKFLLPHETELSSPFIGKLEHLHHNDPVREPIYVMC